MFKEFSNNQKEDDYLSEFRQKIATQQHEDIEARKHELQRSRNGFIGTLAGIALAGIVSWMLLIPHFSNPEATEIPVIRRPITPAKIQPNDPGGMEIPNQDKSVYNLVEKKETIPEKIESILPEPETPVMPVIVPEPEEAAPEPQVTEQPMAEETLPVKNMEEMIDAVTATSGQKINIPEKLSEIVVEAKTVSPVEEKIAAKPSKPQAVKTQTAPKPEAQTSAKISKGVWQVQLIASANKDAVNKAWQDLAAKHPFLKQHPHEVESAKLGSGSIFHRLKVGAFAERSGADALCTKLKQAGGSCLVKQK